MQFDTFDLIDLTSRGLKAVPVTLYAHTDVIVSLNLSRNPMLEIPLDFIQACSTLRELPGGSSVAAYCECSLKYI